LSNPVPWQNWMVAYLGYTLRMRTLFRGWPIMVNDTHTRRRRQNQVFQVSLLNVHKSVNFTSVLVHDLSLQPMPRCIWPMVPVACDQRRRRKVQDQPITSHFYYHNKTTAFVWPHCLCRPLSGPLTCSSGSHQPSPSRVAPSNQST